MLSHSPELKRQPLARWRPRARRGQAGQAAVEFALVLPLLLMFVLGTMALAMFFFQQVAVAAVSSVTARSVALGNQTSLQNPGGEQNELLGLRGVQTSVQISPDQRSVYVEAQYARQVSIPLVGSLTFNTQSGSFTRLWRFWPGPPKPWE